MTSVVLVTTAVPQVLHVRIHRDHTHVDVVMDMYCLNLVSSVKVRTLWLLGFLHDNRERRRCIKPCYLLVVWCKNGLKEHHQLCTKSLKIHIYVSWDASLGLKQALEETYKDLNGIEQNVNKWQWWLMVYQKETKISLKLAT